MKYTIKKQLNEEWIVFEETDESKVMKGIFYTEGEAKFYASVLERGESQTKEENG